MAEKTSSNGKFALIGLVNGIKKFIEHNLQDQVEFILCSPEDVERWYRVWEKASVSEWSSISHDQICKALKDGLRLVPEIDGLTVSFLYGILRSKCNENGSSRYPDAYRLNPSFPTFYNISDTGEFVECPFEIEIRDRMAKIEAASKTTQSVKRNDVGKDKCTTDCIL